jgi:hypothetical protein
MIQEAWIGRSVTGPTARLAKNKPAGPPHRGQEVMKPRWASVLARFHRHQGRAASFAADALNKADGGQDDGTPDAYRHYFYLGRRDLDAVGTLTNFHPERISTTLPRRSAVVPVELDDARTSLLNSWADGRIKRHNKGS